MIVLPLFPLAGIASSFILPFVIVLWWRRGLQWAGGNDAELRFRCLWLLSILPLLTLCIIGIDPRAGLQHWQQAIGFGFGPLQTPRLHHYLRALLPPHPPAFFATTPLGLFPLLLLASLPLMRQIGFLYALIVGAAEWWEAAHRVRCLPRTRQEGVWVLDVPGWSAFAFGLLHPQIYVSRAVWDSPHRAAVIAHERAHVRRRDPLLRLIACAMQRSVWFLPTWRRLTTQLELEAERVCDLRACQTVGRAAYARALLAFADQPAVSGLPASTLLPAFPAHAALSDNIEGLLARVHALEAGEAEAAPRWLWPLFVACYVTFLLFA